VSNYVWNTATASCVFDTSTTLYANTNGVVQLLSGNEFTCTGTNIIATGVTNVDNFNCKCDPGYFWSDIGATTGATAGATGCVQCSSLSNVNTTLNSGVNNPYSCICNNGFIWDVSSHRCLAASCNVITAITISIPPTAGTKCFDCSLIPNTATNTAATPVTLPYVKKPVAPAVDVTQYSTLSGDVAFAASFATNPFYTLLGGYRCQCKANHKWNNSRRRCIKDPLFTPAPQYRR
jgi:hypothetical protein